MNTPTTNDTKAKPTAGPWKYSQPLITSIKSESGVFICSLLTDDTNPEMDFDEYKANAQLIAEAGTVYHETGLTPRELVERINKKNALINKALKMLNTKDGVGLDEIYKILKKATE